MTTPAPTQSAAVLPGTRQVAIANEPVELYKILKFEGLVASGGQAKAAVAAGQVLVNGCVELQKRKKIRTGDTIEFNGDKLCIKLQGPTPMAPAQTEATATETTATEPAATEPTGTEPIQTSTTAGSNKQ